MATTTSPVSTHVSFTSNGIWIAGILFTPDDGTTAPYPALVIGHPGGGVKEQTASLYAERLAAQGFATLVFDAAYQGESGGEPHFLEDPIQRAEDVRSAVTYLTTREDIDHDRVGALGICASGGYVPFAAQTDHRITAVATVSAVEIGDLFSHGLGRTQGDDAVSQALDAAGQARTDEAEGKAPTYATYVPNERPGEDAPVLYQEGYDYYRTPRGGHPRSANKWLVQSMDRIANFDAFARIDMISPRPLLMIAGSEADTRYFSEEAIEKANEPKELFIIEGGTHIRLYDIDEYVSPAVAKLTEFFDENVKNA